MCHDQPRLTSALAQADPTLEDWWRWQEQTFPEDWTAADVDRFNSDMALRHQLQFSAEDIDPHAPRRRPASEPGQ